MEENQVAPTNQQILNALSQMGEAMAAMTNRFEADRIETSRRFQELQNERIINEGTGLPTPQVNRRSSMLVSNQVYDPATLPSTTVTNPSVIHVQKAVDPSKIIEHITIRATLQALLHQDQHKHAHNQIRRLSDFLHPIQVLAKLVANEKRRGSAVGAIINDQTIYDLPDTAILDMMVTHVRDKETLTHDGVTTTLMASINMVVSTNENWEFGISGYDDQLHMQVSKFVESVSKTWKLITLNATSAQMSQWPKDEWGSRNEYGILQIWHGRLGRFKDNFERILKLGDLKKMTSTEEYVKAITAASDKFCDEAVQLKIGNAVATPIKSLQQIQDELRALPLYKRILQPPVRPPPPPAFHNNNNHNHNPQARSNHYPHRDSSARQSALESDNGGGKYDPEDSFLSDASPSPSGDHGLARITPHSNDLFGSFMDVSREEDNPEYSSLDAILGQHGQRPNPDSRTLVDTTVTRPRDPTKPCFPYFYTKQCDGSCDYSHKIVDMIKLRALTLQRLVDSPFGGHDQIVKDLQNIKEHDRIVAEKKSRGYSPQDARLSQVVVEGAGQKSDPPPAADPTPSVSQNSS